MRLSILKSVKLESIQNLREFLELFLVKKDFTQVFHKLLKLNTLWSKFTLRLTHFLL